MTAGRPRDVRVVNRSSSEPGHFQQNNRISERPEEGRCEVDGGLGCHQYRALNAKTSSPDIIVVRLYGLRQKSGARRSECR
jgi:hypothetical protein